MLFCLFGHKKRYVAVRHGWINVGWLADTCDGTEARWVCERSGCLAMGTDGFRGKLAVHQGQLIPDEKAWSNFTS